MSSSDSKVATVGKLYYTSTSCGFASFLSAVRAGLHLETEQVDLQKHTTESGADYYKINPKGNVPSIVLNDGTLLNENAATLSWIADQNLSAGLAPAYGTNSRYAFLAVLAWITSELHPGVGSLFSGGSDEVKAFKKANAIKKIAYFEKDILADGARKFAFGNSFTVADAYAAVVLSWTQYVGIDLTAFPHTAAYLKDQFASDAFTSAKKLAESKPKSI
jgi:glutathione S-transferase